VWIMPIGAHAVCREGGSRAEFSGRVGPTVRHGQTGKNGFFPQPGSHRPRCIFTTASAISHDPVQADPEHFPVLSGSGQHDREFRREDTRERRGSPSDALDFSRTRIGLRSG